MKQFLFLIIIIFIVSFVGLSGYYIGTNSLSNKSDTEAEKEPEKPLEKYTIENLSNTEIIPVSINITETFEEKEEFNTYHFSLEYDPTLQNNPENYKKTTGLINIPNEKYPAPVVVMIRGYVDQTLYQSGMGTRRAAEIFAEQGFITIAPDFLGYAGSDSEAGNIFETRFQTYTTVLTLLDSLDSIGKPEGLAAMIDQAFWDEQNTFIWAHSNGGQIALTVLEIIESDYPTTLWAPVSKPFPYSVLYYTDESQDKGKLIRRELAKFEDLYDVDLFSIHNYFDRIQAPIQIHQGTIDDAVPVEWSNDLTKILENSDVEITYHKYAGSDHNMRPDWDTVVARDLEFFKQFLD